MSGPPGYTAYKLFRVRRDGTLGSLFVDRKRILKLGEWLGAKLDLDPRPRGLAKRPGWHCLERPNAPHLSERGRVWCRVSIRDFREMKRPESQGGRWWIATIIKIEEIL